MNETNNSNQTNITNKDKNDFLRHVIFLEDLNRILAVFPFYHIINDDDFQELIENYGDEIEKEDVKKTDFCLMFEKSFGWGWIYKEFVNPMKQAEKEKYIPLASHLIINRLINSDAILNEDWVEE